MAAAPVKSTGHQVATNWNVRFRQPGFALRVVPPGIVAGSAWVDVLGHLLNVVVLDGFRKERAVSAA